MAETLTISAGEARFWDQLLQLVDEGHVIPIVGRDLLTLSINGREVLLYPYLAGCLAEYLSVSGEDLPAGGEINAVVCRFLEETKGNDIEDVYAGLKVVARRAGDLPIPAPLTKLASIEPIELFVTLTFDSLLERALNETRFGGQPKTRVLSYSPNSATDLTRDARRFGEPTVFHLVGKLSAVPDYAVTDEDLLEFVHALQSETRRPNLLFDELSRKHLLIIGCSYPDWLARFFIRATAGNRLSQARGSSFIADARLREDAALRGFLKSFGVRTKLFFDGGAVEFVDQLHKKWLGRTFVGQKIPSPEELLKHIRIEPGAVFLSYASEDLRAARAIKKSLEAEGIDVWFDKMALSPGDAFEDIIGENIQSCSVFVPILSRHTLTAERRFFRREWAYAERVAEMAAASQRFIIPVAIDETSPDQSELPAKLRRLHWERLPGGTTTPEFVEDIKALFRGYHKARRGGVA